MKALIIKNSAHEGPGILTGILTERDISCDSVDFKGGGSVTSLSPYSAVFVLGGPESANDRTKKMEAEIALVRTILRSGVPYFGICLGMQVLVKAAGGKVTGCRNSEIGWRDSDREYNRIHISTSGRNDPLFAGLNGSLPVFQLHQEMAEPSVFGEVLAFGDECPAQVVKEGKLAYGVQGHIELDEQSLNTLIRTDPLLALEDPVKMVSDYHAIQAEYTANGTRILSNFLDAVQDM